MRTGWQCIDNKWYYLNANRCTGYGKMITGWIKEKIKGTGGYKKEPKYKYYYLYSDGSMASNTTIDGHYLDSSGAITNDVDIASAREI